MSLVDPQRVAVGGERLGSEALQDPLGCIY